MTASPEVVVIGGGPAGATASTLIAQRGHSVRLFEREKFPRFHIGESFMPDTYFPLRRLGMLDKMKASRFTRKYSVMFANDQGKESQPFYFFENNPHECTQTWQVVRSEFDEMMLNNARDHGVDVHEESRVLDVFFEGEPVGASRQTGIRVQYKDGTEEVLHPQVIVDASGQSSLISNKLKLRVPDEKLKKATVWSYFRGAKREPGQTRRRLYARSCNSRKRRAGSGTSRSTTTLPASAWSRALTTSSATITRPWNRSSGAKWRTVPP